MSSTNTDTTKLWVWSTLAFVIVGAAAAATHLLAFKLVLPWLVPEVANVAGFLAAFWVSFFGHRWLSFKDARTGLGESLVKFAVTALAGFTCNELVFIGVHRLLGASPWLAVIAGMLAAAIQTYGLSRYWAFKR